MGNCIRYYYNCISETFSCASNSDDGVVNDENRVRVTELTDDDDSFSRTTNSSSPGEYDISSFSDTFVINPVKQHLDDIVEV